MKTDARRELLAKLIQLGMHYPQMRFGQLVCFAASLAGQDEPGEAVACEDAQLRGAIDRHLSREYGDKGVELRDGLSSLTPVRGDLVDAVQSLGARHAEWPAGKLLENLARLAHVHLYDVEDHDLVQSARIYGARLHWFEAYSKDLATNSVIRERQPKPSYRCPCCGCLTLDERGGFAICPVCYWEDDGQDDHDADQVRGGPNGDLSLTQARQNYQQCGACHPKYGEHVRPPRPQEKQ